MGKKGDLPLSYRIVGWMRVVILAIIMLFLLFGFFSCISMMAFDFDDDALLDGNVAKIPIHGVIGVGNSDSFDSSSSTVIVSLIEKADRDKSIKAIMLDINSGGGTPVASLEIAEAVKRADKPVVAVIRDIGASGAYWIATASDRIFAAPVSITGSIGVRSGHFDISGLLEDNNITYTRLVAGNYKDIGSPFRALTSEEKLLLQKKLDEIHEYFILQVAENRQMDIGKVRALATGMFYTGLEAKESGLIDELGGIEAAKEYLGETLDIEVDIKSFSPKASLYDLIYGVKLGNSIVLKNSAISLS